jgi:hypothetical protein
MGVEVGVPVSPFHRRASSRLGSPSPAMMQRLVGHVITWGYAHLERSLRDVSL